MSWRLGQIQVPDFSQTLDSAQAYQRNALAEMMARKQFTNQDAYEQALQRNADGLRSNDPLVYGNSLADIARSGPEGAKLALPLLQQERENAWAYDPSATAANVTPAATAGGAVGGPDRVPVGVKASAPLKSSGATVPDNLRPIYERAAAKYGIPVDLLIAQGRQESGFNPNAVGGAGEIGLGQIHPKTAADPGYGVPPISAADARDPEKAIDFQARYMAARAKAAGVDFSTPEGQNAALRLYNGGGDPNYVQNVRQWMPGQGAPASAPASGPAAAGDRSSGVDPAMVQRAIKAAALGSPGAIRWLQSVAPMLKRETPNYSFQNIGGTMYAVNPQNPADRVPIGPAGENNEVQTVPDPSSPTGYKYVRRSDAPGQAAPAPSSLVSIENKGPSAFDETYGKALGQRAAEIQPRGAQAGQTLTRLGRVEQILDRIDTGLASGQKITLGQIGAQLGVSVDVLKSVGLDPDATAAREQLRSLTSQMLTGLLGSGGFPSNNFSNADREALERALPNLANSPQGNRVIVDMLKAGAKRDLEISRAWIDWQKTHGSDLASYREFENSKLQEITSNNVLEPLAKDIPDAPKPSSAPPEQGAALALPRANGKVDGGSLVDGKVYDLGNGRKGRFSKAKGGFDLQ